MKGGPVQDDALAWLCRQPSSFADALVTDPPAGPRWAAPRPEPRREPVDADLRLSGQFESPRLTGEITVTGGELNVDEILEQY